MHYNMYKYSIDYLWCYSHETFKMFDYIAVFVLQNKHDTTSATPTEECIASLLYNRGAF